MANQLALGHHSPRSDGLASRILGMPVEMRGFTPRQTSGHSNSSPPQQTIFPIPRVNTLAFLVVTTVVHPNNGNLNRLI
ncbi:unnamed protein product [Prunus armeniaca]|uniref:Uncharacterized protein n=1 Tax=Prunus armeniaca TaxID=36596 RepID=A0A6J5TWD1_PRUAR|nr:unnamed protein product [Prunus armeniaca]CAB4298414.1 unnamed protein product [Prunus armeniaca]